MNALDSIEGFREKWPFTARYARVNGRRMHYVDEGAGDPISASSGLTDRLRRRGEINESRRPEQSKN